MPRISQLFLCYKKDHGCASVLDTLLATFKSFNFLFHSSIFIFTFNHSDFMKGYHKMFSAIKTNKLCDNLFKWASLGISLTEVNFTSFSFTGHHHFYPPDQKWTTTVLGTVPTSFHRNHRGFSGSFQAAVILFNFVTPSIAGWMLWLKKATQLMQHSNVKATQTWEELGKSCWGNQGCERPNQKDYLEDSLVCSEGAEVCVLKLPFFSCFWGRGWAHAVFFEEDPGEELKSCLTYS